jgi:hypothetical protein
MNGEITRNAAEELLLARVSEAAGRACLGRRRTTFRAPSPQVTARWGRSAVRRAARRLLCSKGAIRTARPGAEPRLDLYEQGVTVAVDGRIRVIRYDTTMVRRRRDLSPQGITRAHELVDVDGERIVLRGGDFDRPEVWGPELCRAVTDAQLPSALADLAQGARLTFGPVWVTRDEVGSGRTSLRWPQVQRIGVRSGSVAVRVAGRWQVLGAASGIPNVCVFQALAEHLSGPPPRERGDDRRTAL